MTTSSNNRYILTITCLFTGYLVAVPVKTQETKETVEAVLKYWITVYGWPTAILHDNHQSFASHLFSEMTKVFGITNKRTTRYWSQGNGKCESQNKRIGGAIRAVLSSEKFREWDKWLKYVVFTLNSLKSSRTGVSPHFLVFGRELQSPRDLLLDESDLTGKLADRFRRQMAKTCRI